MHRRRLKIRLKMFRRLLAARQAILIVESDGQTRYLWNCESLKAKKELARQRLDLRITEEQDLS